MTTEFLTLSEGPDFNLVTMPLLALSLLLAAYTTFSFVRTSQEGLLASGSLRRIILRFGVIGCFAVFLLSSAISDLSTWPLMLMTHTAVCWLFLLASFGLVYEMICRIGSRFGVRLWTKYLSVNVVLAWLIGSRAVTFYLMMTGPLGFVLSLTVLSAGLLIYASLFVGRPFALTAEEAAFSSPATTASSFIKSISWNDLFYWALLLILGAAAISVIYINFYRPIGLWDAYTHWLTLPREILFNDKMVGFYEITRSVAPGYSPQQVVDSAILLWFWGDLSASDHMLMVLNPLAFALGVWVILDISREYARDYGGSLLQAALLVLAALIFIHLPVSYRLSVYSDMRGALCILVACLGFFLIDRDKLTEPVTKRSVGPLLFLVILSTTVFSFKPYAWPLAFVPIVVMLLSRCPWKNWGLFGALTILLAIMEILPLQILAPSVQIIEVGSVSSRFIDTVIGAFIPNLEALTAGFAIRENTLETFIGFVILGSLSSFAGFFVKEKRSRLTLLATGLAILGLSVLLLVAMNVEPTFGNSLSRYQINLVLAVLLLAALIFGILNDGVHKWLLNLTLVCGSSYALYISYAASPLAIETEWYVKRLDSLTIFSQPQSPNDELMAQVIREDRAGNPVRLVSNTHQKRLDQYYLNYFLARTTSSAVSISDVSGLPIQDLQGALTLEDLALVLEEKNITHIFLAEAETILGEEISPGFYPVDAFKAALMQGR